MSLLADIIDSVLFPNREIHPIPVLDGAFSPNQRLDRSPKLGDDIERPDDLALGADGALYVSSGARILRCAGAHYEERSLFARLPGPVGGLAFASDGRLLACVSGAGLVALSPAGEIVGRLDRVQGEAIGCPLSVTAARDGTIYLTDGSRTNGPQDWLADLMQARPPSGRLIVCDAALQNAHLRADRLAWPSGLVVSEQSQEVWIAESWAHRLTAFSRAGDRRRVLVKNFAGYPARLAPGTGGDCWMAFFGLRTHLTEFVLRERGFCEEMMRKIPQELWIGPSLDGSFNYREPTQIGRIKKLGIQKPWAPARSYGLVARLNAEGVAVESLHSRVDGRIHGVTGLCVAGGRAIAAVKGRNCLVELSLSLGAEEQAR